MEKEKNLQTTENIKPNETYFNETHFDDLSDNARDIVHGNAKTFKSSQTQYSDYFSSAIILLVFGIAGIVFVILNITKTLTIFSSTFQFVIGFILFGGFLIISIFCYKAAYKYKKSISSEDETQKMIEIFLKENINTDLLKTFDNEDDTEEANYLARLDGITSMVIENFPATNKEFVESLVEEYYTSNY